MKALQKNICPAGKPDQSRAETKKLETMRMVILNIEEV